MIKCPKCGADNMINAIFCRQCGDKLDFAALNIEEQLGLDDSGKKGKGSQRANQIVGAVLAFVIVVLLAALLIPSPGRLACEEPTTAANDLLAKLQKPAEDGTIDFTDQDFTDLLNKNFNLPQQGDDTIKAESISLVCREDGTIKVVMSCSVFGFLPMYTSFVCTPAIGEKKGEIVFNDYSDISLGWLPAILPSDFTDPFVTYFRQQSDSQNKVVKRSTRNVKAIAVTDSKISFTVEKFVSKKGGKK